MTSRISLPEPSPIRLRSIDAYRGFVMVLMLAEVLHLQEISTHFPESGFWKFLAFHQQHVAWTGCSLHDLIQPSFSFLVGVALPFSLGSRAAQGQTPRLMMFHACWRALILVLLGIFLRSAGSDHTNWTFEDTLTQIGMGYPLLFWLETKSVRAQMIALGVILTGYWAAWAVYPVPSGNYDFIAAGAHPGWEHNASGFAAHWNIHTNVGAAFDRWFLNLFPRDVPFATNEGGYLTLNFIPTLGTMILGLFAGKWLRMDISPHQKIGRMATAGILLVAVGLILHGSGLCPLVKRVWTPSWTLFSGGMCFLILAGFYSVIDWRQHRGWDFPLRVVGMNALAAYLISWLALGFIEKTLQTHLGERTFNIFGSGYAPLMEGTLTLAIVWGILFWMFRRKILLKV